MLDQIVAKAPVYMLVAVRCLALVMTLPFFSIRTVSRKAKLAFAGYMAYLIFPHVDFSAYLPYIRTDGSFSLEYLLLVGGEGIIGMITGFYVTMIFAAFSTAGQFFAFNMGFSASEVYDALSQVENPLMGQFFNLIAMLIFLQNDWALRLFSQALVSSFDSLNAFSIISGGEHLLAFMLKGLTKLFADAFIISLPLIGVLVLISVSMGILSKAAPQMNLISEGFPIMILTAFLLISLMIPNLCEFFVHSFQTGFANLEQLIVSVSGSGGS
ncbi:MAG: flagellar biosynthetic protein FliR [Treponema sp.]|nr:flagellar biosynthetic protein FliR [Treponema sp.]